MKRVLAGLLVVLALAILAGASHAAGPPVRLDHTLLGVTAGDGSVTAEYTLTVENSGEVPLSEVTLSLVPLAPLLAQRTTIHAGYLAPHEKKELFVQVVTPIQLDRQRLSGLPLFWAGSYLDPDGKAVQFPARSTDGGAK